MKGIFTGLALFNTDAVERVFVSCTVLMCLHFSLLGAPDAVNIHYFVWKLVSVLYKLSVSQSVNHVPLETDPVIFFG